MRKVLQSTLATIGVISAVCSVFLLLYHMQILRVTSTVSVPKLASITVLESTAATLQKQVDLAELQSVKRNSGIDEQVLAYIVPDSFDIDRLVAIFDLFVEQYSQENLIQSDAQFALEQFSTSSTVRVQLQANMHEEALRALLMLQELSGLITVYDALTAQQRQVLIERIETENPTAITELEAFFATQLTEYAREPQAVQDRLLRSFDSPRFSVFLTEVLESSRLPLAQELFTSVYGKSLIQNTLWPLPFLQLESVSTVKGGAKGWHSVSLTFIISTVPSH